ncbi:hypothetical protein KR038_004263 [Drosophila bunnanda]|nr:hypothetical protein KR038_004263 [Drosophila bunnanda]
MATTVRQFTRSTIRQARQPRWKQLLLKSYKNLHLKAICNQRRFISNRDKGCDSQEEEKFCIDYKKNPTDEEHEPPGLPDLQPVSPKLRITRRRQFLKEKKCKDLVKELEMENPEGNDTCSKFSKLSLIWEKPRNLLAWHKINCCLLQLSKLRSLDPDSVHLNQERTFSRKVDQEQACLAIQPSPSKPVPPQSERMARKRRHFQAKQQKKAEAKAFANSNTQTNELAEEKHQATPLARARPLGMTPTEQAELKELLAIIKERCRKKFEEFERAREAEIKKEAEEAALRNQAKMAQIRKLCREAKKYYAFKMAQDQKESPEAQLRKQSEAKPRKERNQSEEAKLRNHFTRKKRDTFLNSKKD